MTRAERDLPAAIAANEAARRQKWERLNLENAAAERCPWCDGTGDVHDVTGEWRGECVCKDGKTAGA